MTTIYIARHGQNEDNVRGILNGHRDLPLTDLGRQQARQLARHIKDRELVLTRCMHRRLIELSRRPRL